MTQFNLITLLFGIIAMDRVHPLEPLGVHQSKQISFDNSCIVNIGAVKEMSVLSSKKAQTTFPTGDPRFSVMQAFPAVISAEDADPFLMCDHFGPTLSSGKESDPDVFPIGWHPHRGIDLLTYMIQGTGRHADSLGNREEFEAPGMQWISSGSGIEHAEGGGTPDGLNTEGFQIWVNVPSGNKMDDPRYGTHTSESIPVLSQGTAVGTEILPVGLTARVLAGSSNGLVGPFSTIADIQMIDFTLEPNTTYQHVIPSHWDNCMVYVYRGLGSIGTKTAGMHQVIHMDASDALARGVTLSTAGMDVGLSVLLFAGKRLLQPIAWRGPFVMTTAREIKQTVEEYQQGRFLRKRAAWDYKRIASKR